MEWVWGIGQLGGRWEERKRRGNYKKRKGGREKGEIRRKGVGDGNRRIPIHATPIRQYAVYIR